MRWCPLQFPELDSVLHAAGVCAMYVECVYTSQSTVVARFAVPKSVPLSESTAFHPSARHLYASLHHLYPFNYRPIHHLSDSICIHTINSNTYTAMFRSAILRSQLPTLRSAVRPIAASALRPAPIAFSRTYAAAAGLSKDDISSRVLEVMKSFEKVDGGKVG